MRFREFNIAETIILELFNKPEPWSWTQKTEDRWVGKFVINKIPYILVLDKDTNLWHLEFYDDSKEWEQRYSITGTQKEQSIMVFSTVIDIIKNFKNAHPEESIKFTADEPSRKKLYDRLVVAANRLGLSAEIDERGSTKSYVIG